MNTTNVIEPPLVDSHAHVFTRALPMVPKPRHRPDYDFTYRDYVAELDRHGVGFGVIVAASIYGDYNDYTLEALAAFPDRLRGTVQVEPTIARDRLDRMAAAGIVGIRLPWLGIDPIPDLASPDYAALLRHIRDLDWHVHLHAEGQRLTRLIPILEASGVKLVIDHMGRPDPATGIDGEGFKTMLRAIDHGRTWVKLSAGYRIGREPALRYAQALLAAAGPERLFWASDCPFVGCESLTSYAATIADFREWVPDAATRRAIDATAHAFFFGGGVT